MKTIRPYLFFLACFFVITTLQAQDLIKLEGKILAADTKEPVPFASVGLPEKGIGNICNETGHFELKIPVTAKNSEVCITALGFKELCLPASTFLAKNPTVLLEPANLKLATVEIKANTGESLVREAVKRIPENYAAQPVHYTFYQRQLEKLNDKPAYIIESVNEAYRNHPKKDYQLTIKKSRGMATSDENRKSMNETWLNVFSILGNTDIAKRREYLHPSKFSKYSYQVEKETVIGNDTVFVVAYKPKPTKNGDEVPGQEGKVYIHNRSKAIIRVESKPNQAEIDKDNNNLLVKAAGKMIGGELTFGVGIGVSEYRKIGNRWYFSNFHREYSSQIRKKGNETADRYYNINQLVVTNTKTENAPQIPEEQRVKRFGNEYSTAPKDMNEAFWQQYNVLPLPDGFQTFEGALN